MMHELWSHYRGRALNITLHRSIEVSEDEKLRLVRLLTVSSSTGEHSQYAQV